jgi:hypothetical protein
MLPAGLDDRLLHARRHPMRTVLGRSTPIGQPRRAVLSIPVQPLVAGLPTDAVPRAQRSLAAAAQRRRYAAEPSHSTNTDRKTDELGGEDISGNREFQQWNH